MFRSINIINFLLMFDFSFFMYKCLIWVFFCVSTWWISQQNQSELSDFKDKFDSRKIWYLHGKVQLALNDAWLHTVSNASLCEPIEIKAKLKSELDTLVEIGSVANWASRLTGSAKCPSSIKEDGQLRICVDPRPLNQG